MWMLGTEPGSSAKQTVFLIFELFPVLSMGGFGERDSHLFGHAILKERGTCVLSDLAQHCPRHSFCSHGLRIGTVEHVLTLVNCSLQLVSWAQFYISVLRVSRYGFCDRDIELYFLVCLSLFVSTDGTFFFSIHFWSFD